MSLHHYDVKVIYIQLYTFGNFYLTCLWLLEYNNYLKDTDVLSTWDVNEFGEDEKRLTHSYVSSSSGFQLFWEARTEFFTLPPPTLNDQRHVNNILQEHIVQYAHTCWVKLCPIAVRSFNRYNRFQISVLSIRDIILKRVRDRNVFPTELEEVVTQEYQNIPQEKIKNLIKSMLRS